MIPVHVTSAISYVHGTKIVDENRDARNSCNGVADRNRRVILGDRSLDEIRRERRNIWPVSSLPFGLLFNTRTTGLILYFNT